MIRKTARLATRFNAHFAVLYVQTDRESSDRIPLANQRYLINNFKLASELGGEVLQIHSNHPIEAIIDTCVKQKSVRCASANRNLRYFRYSIRPSRSNG